jgi:hypothetical protein
VSRALGVLVFGLVHNNRNLPSEERRARVRGLVKDKGNVEQEARGLAIENVRSHGPPTPHEGARLTPVKLGVLNLPEDGLGPGHE